MMRKRRWLWIVLFIIGAALWITLATGWNVVIVRDYHHMLELAKASVANKDSTEAVGMGPWPFIIIGWLGFSAALVISTAFFIKTLQEMRVSQLQAEFLATVSHELKTPIASIELSSSLLRTGQISEEEARRLWDSHQAELKRLRSEVEAILEAARWQANPMRVRPEPTDLESWLETSMQRWKNLLGPACRLSREGDALPREVRMDLRSLNLITDNLIDNARKFAKGSPSVTIRTQRTPKQWKIEIHDQGWGFDPDESQRIFRRFFRAQHSAPYSIPGTGLGLYLASSASRALKIKLSGTSGGVGKGAIFTLEGKM